MIGRRPLRSPQERPMRKTFLPVLVALAFAALPAHAQ